MSIINKIKSLKSTTLIIIFLSIVILIIIVLTSTQKKAPQPLPTTPPSSPATFINPSPILSISESNLPSYLDLKIIKISPPKDSFPAGDTTNAFYIYFDKPIDPSSVKITSEPQLTFKVKILPDNLTRINIIPNTPWQANQLYSITVHKGIVSTDKQSALKDNIYKTLDIKEIPLPVFNRPI